MSNNPQSHFLHTVSDSEIVRASYLTADARDMVWATIYRRLDEAGAFDRMSHAQLRVFLAVASFGQVHPDRAGLVVSADVPREIMQKKSKLSRGHFDRLLKKLVDRRYIWRDPSYRASRNVPFECEVVMPVERGDGSKTTPHRLAEQMSADDNAANERETEARTRRIPDFPPPAAPASSPARLTSPSTLPAAEPSKIAIAPDELERRRQVLRRIEFGGKPLDAAGIEKVARCAYYSEERIQQATQATLKVMATGIRNAKTKQFEPLANARGYFVRPCACSTRTQKVASAAQDAVRAIAAESEADAESAAGLIEAELSEAIQQIRRDYPDLSPLARAEKVAAAQAAIAAKYCSPRPSDPPPATPAERAAILGLCGVTP